MNPWALAILIGSCVTATICLVIAGIGIYRFALAWIEGIETETFW